MKQITIAKIELKKEGETNGKAWAIYQVTDSQGKKYSAFGSILNASGTKEGETYLVDTQIKKNGQYTNETIKSISRVTQAPKAPQNAEYHEIMGILNEISAQLVEINLKLNDDNKKSEINEQSPF